MELLLVFLVFWGLCGLVAGVMFESRGHSGCSGFALGFLFGPLGILIAAVTPPTQATIQQSQRDLDSQRLLHGELKKCPYCAELIKREAKVCRYCGRDLPSIEQVSEPEPENVPPPATARQTSSSRAAPPQPSIPSLVAQSPPTSPPAKSHNRVLIGLFLLGAIVLVGGGLVTLSAFIQQNYSGSSSMCDAQSYLQEENRIFQDFNQAQQDSVNIQKTSRERLPGYAEQMRRDRDAMQTLNVPPCAQEHHAVLVLEMTDTVDGYDALLRGDEALSMQKVNEANALHDRLMSTLRELADANGKPWAPTPTPIRLAVLPPTETPTVEQPTTTPASATLTPSPPPLPQMTPNLWSTSHFHALFLTPFPPLPPLTPGATSTSRCGDYSISEQVEIDPGIGARIATFTISDSQGQPIKSFRPDKGDGRQSFHLDCADFTQSGVPDLAIEVYTVQADCCSSYDVLSMSSGLPSRLHWDTGFGRIDGFATLSGKPPYEIVGWDGRLLYFDVNSLENIGTFLPVVFAFRGGRYVPATRDYPQVLRDDRTRAFQSLAQPGVGEEFVKGQALEIYADGVWLNEETATLASLKAQVSPSVASWLENNRAKALQILAK